MTSTTLTLQEFSDKLQQAATHSITSEGKPIMYTPETLLLITADVDADSPVATVAYFDVPGAPEIAPTAPYLHNFDLKEEQAREALYELQETFMDFFTLEDETEIYNHIVLTLRDESGDHIAIAVVPLGFEYDLSESLIIDGTGYQCKSDHNILE